MYFDLTSSPRHIPTALYMPQASVCLLSLSTVLHGDPEPGLPPLSFVAPSVNWKEKQGQQGGSQQMGMF